MQINYMRYELSADRSMQRVKCSEWDRIPGARGCTPQALGFRDLHPAFRELGIEVYGISTQTSGYQREFAQRNRLPFELLSDSQLVLTRALRLPTFEFPVREGGPNTLIK